jgi:hypothetical protein
MSNDPINNPQFVSPGDVIQIVDIGHGWFPALLVVNEVKPWGVQAYTIMPRSNMRAGEKGYAPASEGYNRLEWHQFSVVGRAVVTHKEGHHDGTA